MIKLLDPVPMPTHAVLVGITASNSWPTGTFASPRRCAYIATDSTQPLAFVSLQAATHPTHIRRVAARPALLKDMPHGLVIELDLTHDLTPNETIHLAIAQAGATTYYAPQPIDDLS